ncbi:hypothetical protein C8R45DRAFT_538067 [Mycena sanguinolenta]|nr:hypothetical protein C8R45DRAFT_538067 [Mycena sanguinolenta]
MARRGSTLWCFAACLLFPRPTSGNGGPQYGPALSRCSSNIRHTYQTARLYFNLRARMRNRRARRARAGRARTRRPSGPLAVPLAPDSELYHDEDRDDEDQGKKTLDNQGRRAAPSYARGGRGSQQPPGCDHRHGDIFAFNTMALSALRQS